MTGNLFVNLRNKTEDSTIISKLAFEKAGDVTEVKANIKCECTPYNYAVVMKSDFCAWADFEIDEKIEGVLSRVQFNPFWARPSFEKDLSKVEENIQNMLLKTNDGYIAVLPLCIDDYNAFIATSEKENVLRVKITKYFEGSKELCGAFVIFAEDKNPFEAVRKAYKYAVEKGYIKTKMREDKKLPEIYKGFGWCTWDAFYHDVNAEGIIQKMEEFKAKNVQVDWVMIDDGWTYIKEEDKFVIGSFFEDKTKFPEGLSGCIKRLKEEYGVKQVGIWHSLTGYWFGVEKDSELFEKQESNLIKTNSGYFIPSGEGAYEFFNTWHMYLKEQGVDFVKIDTQGNTTEFLKGKENCVKIASEIQQAIDRSVYEVFGGNVINCMGMHNINVHNRPYTSVMRSSDDFFPKKPESFRSHIEQNIYNAVFLSNLYYCDFDMWWTENHNAEKSRELRAISGGPVYVSDMVGKTDGEHLSHLFDENGKMITYDSVALPTEDCLFGYDKVLKVWNVKDGNVVVKEFDLSEF